MSSFKLRKEKDCLNCGHVVEKHFCPECGQENIEVKEDAFHMVAHAVADYFHFEHKFFATLKPLLLKPGKLTQAYVAGKRVSYIHPIRLYIFISIIFFLIVLGSNTFNTGKEKEEATKAESTPKKLTPKEIDARLKKLEKGMNYAPMSAAVKDSILKAAKLDLENGGKTHTTVNLGNGSSKFIFGGGSQKLDSTVALYEKKQLALPKTKRDGFIKHYIKKRIIEVNKYPNPKEKFIEDLLHNIPKMMFLLLPLFALILKVVYINKKKYYYEHLIYSFHVHSAIFLAVIFTQLLSWLSGFIFDLSELFILICSIYLVWYIYRSLRTFYVVVAGGLRF